MIAAASIAGRKGREIDAAIFDEVRDKRDRAVGVITVPEYQYPTLVTFADITDTASVKLVNPADLSDQFGLGVQLKSTTLEVTYKSVTEGVVKGMTGLLSQYPEVRLVPSISPTDFSHEA